MLFVIEDNRYGISTPTDAMMPYRLGVLGEETLVRVDARDAFALYDAGRKAVARARRGDGPTVLWCEMDRLCSHTSSDDHRLYRGTEEIAIERLRDPLELLAQRLFETGALEPRRMAAGVDRPRRAGRCRLPPRGGCRIAGPETGAGASLRGSDSGLPARAELFGADHDGRRHQPHPAARLRGKPADAAVRRRTSKIRREACSA